MIAVLDQKTAEALGVGWALFDAKGVIRQGPMAIELDNVYDGATQLSHDWKEPVRSVVAKQEALF